MVILIPTWSIEIGNSGCGLLLSHSRNSVWGLSTCNCSTSLSSCGIQLRDKWQFAKNTQLPWVLKRKEIELWNQTACVLVIVDHSKLCRVVNSSINYGRSYGCAQATTTAWRQMRTWIINTEGTLASSTSFLSLKDRILINMHKGGKNVSFWNHWQKQKKNHPVFLLCSQAEMNQVSRRYTKKVACFVMVMLFLYFSLV